MEATGTALILLLAVVVSGYLARLAHLAYANSFGSYMGIRARLANMSSVSQFREHR